MNTGNIRFSSNKARDVSALFHKELDTIYGSSEVSVFIDMLFEDFVGWDKVRMLLNGDGTVNQSDLLRFHWALEDLLRQRPIQHIIGWTDFCGCRIHVDESTLIPRPETEEIVQKTIAYYGERHPCRVLDLCTGSGCIAIALAKAWPDAEVMAADISPEALMKARQNAETNGVRVEFIETDILKEKIALPHPVDLMISNPPYVMDSERSQMHRNVLDYEPWQALFVEDSDPLVFYKKIAELWRTMRSKEGIAIAEINERWGAETLKVFEREGGKGRIEKDFRGKDRMIIVE
ncbi:MAG: peptide chain release factor N(5)-glutamine methyltransferase [Bacteroidales bacterium]|nr:peptide chain release factor N(5)-glutamine methyltransferase [Bacteroidales bacterium]